MKIDELSEPERALWEAFPRGESVDMSGGDLDFDSTNTWGAERTVRAEVISALLLGARDNEPGHDTESLSVTIPFQPTSAAAIIRVNSTSATALRIDTERSFVTLSEIAAGIWLR